MESKYNSICNELQELGYTERLTVESLPLVHHLLSDLKTTTLNLQKYMNIAQQALEERDSLKLGAEPYKCDNAKLIKECNDLHLSFIQFKERHVTIVNDLKKKITSLEKEKEVWEARFNQLKSEKQYVTSEKTKNQKFNSTMAISNDKILFLTNEVKKLKDQQLRLTENNNHFQKQIHNRDKEIERLSKLLEGGHPSEDVVKNCCYKNIDNKITDYKDEIKSLISEKNSLQHSLREALVKQHEAMRRALHLAERNKQLENELKDIDQIALEVEVECNNAVQDNVGKVNRLRDQANESRIRIENLEREVGRLQKDKLELNSDLEVIKLEKMNLQRMLETEIENNKRLNDQLDRCKIIENDLNMEIDRLSRLSSEQKRMLADLDYNISSKGTSSKHLTVISEEPSPKESKSNQSTSVRSTTRTKTVTSKVKHNKLQHSENSVIPTKLPKNKKHVKQDIQMELDNKYCTRCATVFKELLDRESALRETQISQSMESLRKEKEYYLNEYLKLIDQGKSSSAGIPNDVIESLNKDKEYYMAQCQKLQEHKENIEKEYKELLKKSGDKDEGTSNELLETLTKEKDYYMKAYYEVLQKLKEAMKYEDRSDHSPENELKIKKLQDEINNLNEEKQLLLARLEDQDRISGEIINVCSKLPCKRREREIEMLKDELLHLSEERDILMNRIKVLNQSSSTDQDRLKKAFNELEEHCQKLESERRELLQSQNTRRSTITQLEDQYDILKEQLRTTQIELNNQKASYNQLKNLHEQTDKTLVDTQGKLLQTETEFANLKLKLNNTSRTTDAQENEIATLNNDIRLMKTQLNKLETEKDNLLCSLDKKTELIASLEDQIQTKNNKVTSLEDQLENLKRKLGKSEGDSLSNEKIIRSLRNEISSLELQYENERKTKEAALAENKRLQDDLNSLTYDCRNSRKELDISRRQVEDLKRQLQHYVAEVKRTEDLISQKELERNEILDQFKSLSEEANLLETNNHTLESEANQSRVQLSVALDHASDLEKRLHNQESVIKSYEKQISTLTAEVASMEMRLKQHNTQYDIMDLELKQMRDLCVKLDQDKEALRRELIDKEDLKSQFRRRYDNLQEENQILQKTIQKDQNSVQGLEKLLSETRHELIEQRLLNQELQSEVNRFRAKIDELQDRLKTSSEQLEIYQEKALEYSRQNKQLRKEIANDRFGKTDEVDSKRYPSL